MGNYKFILSGGGTGGHIYPAIAIANELKKRYPDAEFLFVGAKDRMEMEKVPQAGYRIKGLWISGLERKVSFKNLMFPFKVIHSLIKANKILKQFKPDVAIGTGGFASGPTLRAAASRGIPCVLQEQNSYAGITNKWLASKADRICVAYPGMERFFPKEKMILTGNPIREDIVQGSAGKENACKHFDLHGSSPVILILGGSLGARSINELAASRLEWFTGSGLQVLWQCGSRYYDAYKTLDSGNIRVKEFIKRMDLAYAAADIIISRAGAGSVSELCIAGKPVIFIPSPNVAEDHQTKNAQALVSQKAALMVPEAQVQDSFNSTFTSLLENPGLKEELSKNIKLLAKPDATKQIADVIQELMDR